MGADSEQIVRRGCDGSFSEKKAGIRMCDAFDRHHQQAEKMKRRSELQGAAVEDPCEVQLEAMRHSQALALFFKRI